MKRIFYILMTAMMVYNVSAQTKNTLHINWSVAATMPPATGKDLQPGVAGPVTGISGDVLIIAGGANFPDGIGGNKKYHDDIYLFHHATRGNISPGKVSHQRLPQPVAYCANVITPAGLIYIGGENEKGISNQVVLLKCNADEISFNTLPVLPVPLTNAMAAYSNNVIYVAGGESAAGPSAKCFFLNISQPGAVWQTLPDVPVALSFAVMVAQNNGLYLLGGRRKNANGISDIFNTVYRFDLLTQQWQTKHPLPYAMSAGTGMATGKTGILLFSGDKGEVFSKVEKLNAAISGEQNEEHKQTLLKEKSALLNTHPGFTKTVLLYNTATEQCMAISPLTFAGQVTTAAFPWQGHIIIPAGEIKAGVRTPQIISGRINYGHAK